MPFVSFRIRWVEQQRVMLPHSSASPCPGRDLLPRRPVQIYWEIFSNHACTSVNSEPLSYQFVLTLKYRVEVAVLTPLTKFPESAPV